MVGIYKITSPSGKVYIGQSKNIERRFLSYKKYKCDRQPSLYASLKKYGHENHLFEIIYEFPKDVDRSVMDNYEQFIIAQFKGAGVRMMNLNEGGKTNQELSDETRKKLAAAHIGKQYWLGKKHTEETKQKIRDGNTGKVFTPERLAAMSRGNIGKPGPNKGKKMSEETKRKLSNSKKGVPMSEEIKQRISNTLKGRTFSDAHRLRLSIAGKGKKKPKKSNL